jgi:3-dehydroquinate dehydratase II
MAAGRAEAGAAGARSPVTVLVLNGPNLGMLGTREPEIYGTATLADVASTCTAVGELLGMKVDLRQTDDEAELVGWVHEAAERRLPIVINPAAFTHYSYALRDALAMRTAPLVELHMSNPAARESFRHVSVVAGVADGTVAGFGLHSYELALRAIATLLGDSP